MLRNPLLVGFILVWMSVFVLKIGTYFKLTSPQYMEWAAIEMQPEALQAQGIFGKSEDVSFTFCYYLGIGMLFTAGTVVVHVMLVQLFLGVRHPWGWVSDGGAGA